MRPLRLFWWHHKDRAFANVGDAMNPLILEAVSGRSVEYATIETCDMVAIGSIMEAVVNVPLDHAVGVWGTGFIRDGAPSVRPHLEIAALRGPASALQAGVKTPTLGDPGLFANLLVPRLPPKLVPIGVVPHYVDLDNPIVEQLAHNEQVRVISPLLTPARFITEVASCDMVFSSSLHGLVIADAVGVPNQWIELSSKVIGNGYKFRDYLAGYGLLGQEPIRPESSALFTAALAEEIAANYHRPTIDQIRSDLGKALNSLLG